MPLQIIQPVDSRVFIDKDHRPVFVSNPPDHPVAIFFSQYQLRAIDDGDIEGASPELILIIFDGDATYDTQLGGIQVFVYIPDQWLNGLVVGEGRQAAKYLFFRFVLCPEYGLISSLVGAA